MSEPFEPIVPPPSVPPLDNPPDPDRRFPGEEPFPDPEPDEGRADHPDVRPFPDLGNALPRRPPAAGGSRMSGNWKDDFRDKLEDFVGSLVVEGAKQSDVYDAIVEEIGNIRSAYDHDPDPADDRPGAEAEEPSNEWPGALP